MTSQESMEVVKFFVSAASSWFTPLMQGLVSKSVKKIRLPTLQSAFTDYLARCHGRWSMLDSFIFPNIGIKLTDVYEPLTIVRASPKETITVRGFPNELLRGGRDVLIVDAAGMGKSTITKYLALASIEVAEKYPIIIELRKLTGTFTTLEFILAEINSLKEIIEYDDLIRLLGAGRFIFFLDGFYEISTGLREIVSNDIRRLKNWAKGCSFVLTSRDQQNLASFSSFIRFNIAPLNPGQSRNLLERYAHATSTVERGKRLIEKLEHPENRHITQFLTNPLTAALLLKTFLHRPYLPMQKYVFYREVFEALFRDHDLAKSGDYSRPKDSGLTMDEFEQILRGLGYYTFVDGQIEFSQVQLDKYLEKLKKGAIGIEFQNSDFIRDAIANVPILIKDGGSFRWTNQAMQEYFCAHFLCRDIKPLDYERIMDMFYSKIHLSRNIDVMMLYHEMDYKSFRFSILKRLLKELLSEYDEIYQKEKFPRISDDCLRSRREVCTLHRFFWVNIPSSVDLNKKNESYDDFTRKLKNSAEVIPNRRWKALNPTWFLSKLDWSTGISYHPKVEFLRSFLGRKGFEFLTRVGTENERALLPDAATVVRRLSGISDPPLLIDDRVENPLNSEEVFSVVTDILSSHFHLAFSGDAASEILSRIDAEQAETVPGFTNTPNFHPSSGPAPERTRPSLRPGIRIKIG